MLDVDVAHIGQSPDCQNIRIQVELVGFGLYEKTEVSCADVELIDEQIDESSTKVYHEG